MGGTRQQPDEHTTRGALRYVADLVSAIVLRIRIATMEIRIQAAQLRRRGSPDQAQALEGEARKIEHVADELRQIEARAYEYLQIELTDTQPIRVRGGDDGESR